MESIKHTNVLSLVLMGHSQIQIITGVMLVKRLVKHVRLGQIVQHVTIKQSMQMTTVIRTVKGVLSTDQIFIIVLIMKVVILNAQMVHS